MAAGQAAAVPKFGSWDAENIGYTVFFEKVRDNKAPPAPKAGHDFDPYEHYENLSRKVPSRPPSSHGHHAHHSGQPPPAAPPKATPAGYDYDHYENLSSRNVPSRPPSSHGHGHGPIPAAAPRGHGSGYDPYDHYENLSGRNVPSRPPSSHGHAPAPPPQHHRRTGSNGSSVASETSSKFSPPRPYQPRYSSNNHHHHQAPQQRQQDHGQYYHPQGAPASGYRPYASPSPPPPLRRPKASAVPRFGVWDEQNAAMAAQGFTVQFEKVKRHREEVKAAAAPPVQRDGSPDRYAPAPGQSGCGKKKRKGNRSFLSKVYRCMFPVVRE